MDTEMLDEVVPPLLALPPELFDHILRFIPEPHGLIPIACTNSTLCERVMASSVWSDLLTTYWPFDNASVARIFERPTSRRRQHPHDGHAAFCRRMAEEKEVGRIIEGMVETPRGRIKAVELISKQFMDIVDAVRRYRENHGRSQGDFAVDYHSLNIERHLSRKLGFHILDKIRRSDDEDVAGGYTALFALFAVSCFRDTDGLILNLWQHIQGMYAHHLFGEMANETTREAHIGRGELRRRWLLMPVEDQIADVGLCMTRNGYVPADEQTYNSLPATFLGSAMLEKHPTIPINLVAIFCALCQEFGVEAKPVGFPGQMLAVVLDGDRRIFVSPFNGYTILTPQDLATRLSGMGFGSSRGDLTRPVSGKEIVVRCARNVFDRLERGTVSMSGMPALYAGLSSLKLVGERGPLAEAQFASLVAIHYPLDVGFWETLEEPEWEDQFLRTRLNDVTKRDPQRRFKQTREIVHRVGLIFRHRLFTYFAVIVGWDSYCKQSEQWMAQMRIDSLPYGRYQPFYHVVVTDGSSRYVAQENIIPLPNPEIDAQGRPKRSSVSSSSSSDGNSTIRRFPTSDVPAVDPRTTLARQRVLARFGLIDNEQNQRAVASAAAAAAVERSFAGPAAAQVVVVADAAAEDDDDDDNDNDHNNDRSVRTEDEERERPTTTEFERDQEQARETAALLCEQPEIGKYFRYYRGGRFVLSSDLREEYPDDVDHDLDDGDEQAGLDEAAAEAKRRREEELDDELARLS